MLNPLLSNDRLNMCNQILPKPTFPLTPHCCSNMLSLLKKATLGYSRYAISVVSCDPAGCHSRSNAWRKRPFDLAPICATVHHLEYSIVMRRLRCLPVRVYVIRVGSGSVTQRSIHVFGIENSVVSSLLSRMTSTVTHLLVRP